MRFSPIAVLAVKAWCLGCMTVATAPVHAACKTTSHKLVRVSGVADAQTLHLEDGSEVRLVGVLPPQTPRWWKKPAPWPPADAARRALAALTKSHPLELRFAEGEERRDRHNRILAHVFVMRGEERIWVQAHLVSAGLARVVSFSRHRACARDLQRVEERARANSVGLWSKEQFTAISAADTDALSKRRFSFQLVEGTVRSVATTPKWTFLNFDDDWRRDFTIAIAAKNRRMFRGSDVNLEALEGKAIRARGWLENWNGPAIKVTHPEQIELLESENK
ncbi:MAG: thermonuclease family protein [Hyphomicrobiaceae bacterium]|nr:thermonuclease family protein [Hyphomicrobiaceae bacterium]